MKLFKVFALYGTCMLVFCRVKTLATEATMSANNLNDIDFYNNSLSSTATSSVSHFRGKRFIAFPVGSSFSTAVCMTTGVIGNPNYQYLSFGLNWGIAYNLPNSTWVLQQVNGFGTKDSADMMDVKIKRRHRRDLYGKLETLINGVNRSVGACRGDTGHTRSLPSAGASLQRRLLSRPKRYLSFPEGSSFSVAVCFTVGIIGNPSYNYMSFGLNWGVAYDLPNTTWILNHLHGFAKTPIPVATWHRRSRRFLYGEIERVVDNMGYNGRDCVLRALCESRHYFQNTKIGMIGEMLRVVFSLPKQRLYRRELEETPDIGVYDKAYRKARSMDIDCSSQYECNFSLLELAFGKYSTPPTGYYEQH